MALRLPRPTRESDKPDVKQVDYWRERLYTTFSLVGTNAAVAPGLIAGGAIGTFTITVTGCLANQGQTVELAAPSAIEAGLVWSGFISSNGVVTVRLHNVTGGNITPASASWSARVLP